MKHSAVILGVKRSLVCLAIATAAMAQTDARNTSDAVSIDLTVRELEGAGLEVRWYAPRELSDFVVEYQDWESGEVSRLSVNGQDRLELSQLEASRDYLFRVLAKDGSGRTIARSPQEKWLSEASRQAFAAKIPAEAPANPTLVPTLNATLKSLDSNNFPFIYTAVAIDTGGQPVGGANVLSFTAHEDGRLQTDFFDVTPPDQSGGVRILDFVFLIDNSGSMEPEHQDVKNNVAAFADSLAARQIDFRLGLVRFGQSANSGYPIIINNGVMTSDVNLFKSWLNLLTAAGGFEPGLLAISQAATSFNFRPGSQRHFLLITDEDSDEGSLSQTISVCQSNGIVVHGAVNCFDGHANSDYCTPTSIRGATGGLQFDVIGPYSHILVALQINIGNTYVVRYRTDNPSCNGQQRAVQITANGFGQSDFVVGRYTPCAAPRIQRTQATINLSNTAQVAGVALTIAAECTDLVAPFLQSVVLFHRTTGSTNFISLSMSHIGGNIYQAVIPGSAVMTPGLDYYITATDGQVTTFDPPVDPSTVPYQIAVLPNQPPQISHTPVTSATSGNAVSISATVTDNTNFLSSVTLYYREIGALLFTGAAMSNVGGNQYQATIPGSAVTASGVEYYIRAVDNHGLATTHGLHTIVVASNVVFTITDAGSLPGPDNDGDGYYESLQVNWRIGISSGQERVYGKLYRRNASGTESLVLTTPPYTVVAGTANDLWTDPFTTSERSIFDFRVDVYRVSDNAYLTGLGYNSDPDWIDIPLEPADASCLTSFVDDFNDGNAAGWLPKVSSRWSVQSVNGDLAYCLNVPDPGGDEYSLLAGMIWNDFVLELDAKTNATTYQNYFILFGAPDFANPTYNGYYLQIATGGIRLYRTIAGVGPEIAFHPANFASDHLFHRIRIVRQSPNVKIYVDGVLYLDLNDGTFASGAIGFGSFKGTASFDDVHISGATGATQFSDNFEDGVANGWTPQVPSRWQVSSDAGSLRYFLNTTDYDTPDDKLMGEISLLENYLWEDFTFECLVKSADVGTGNSAADLCMVFGYQDFDSYYYAMLNSAPGVSAIHRVHNGGERVTLVTYPQAVFTDINYHTFKVERSGSLILVFFDGAPILSAVDAFFGEGRIGVGSFNDSGYFDNVSISGGCTSPAAAIFPWASSPQNAGREFWVDLKVGTSSTPVNNLFGLSFVLNYTQTTYLDVVTPYSSNVLPGSFMGNDPVFYQSVDDPNGKVSVGISRKSGQGGVSGDGPVAHVKFLAKPNTPNGTQVLFSLSNLVANDPNGNPIALNPGTITVTINSGLIVWPGDTNNNGIVNQADVLPIGLYWDRSGPERANRSNAWIGQLATPWSPEAATYADADGSGRVDQADILPVGLNWGRTHSTLLAESSLRKSNRSQRISWAREGNLAHVAPGQAVWLQLSAVDAEDLFGLSMEVGVKDPSNLRIVAIEPSASFGEDVLFFSRIDSASGRAAFSVSRKSPESGFKGTGVILRLKVEISKGAQLGENAGITLNDILAIAGNGAALHTELSSSSLELLVSDHALGETRTITKYQLYSNYPNPFNPETLIRYDLLHSGEVSLELFNVAGQRIRSLVSSHQEAGTYGVVWDGRNDSGWDVPSGIYFYRLQAGSFAAIRRMALIR